MRRYKSEAKLRIEKLRRTKDTEWGFHASMRNTGSDIIWAEQRHLVTGEGRWVRTTSSTHGDATNGKSIARYECPRN